MKFSVEQVLAVLEPADRPLTTADVKETCYENAGKARYSGATQDVREALDTLVARGDVVRAQRSGHRPSDPANPYKYIALYGYGNQWFWMTKANAEAYKVKLDAQAAHQAALNVKAEWLRDLLDLGPWGIKVEAYIDGTGRFELKGDEAAFGKIVAALEAAQVPA